MKVRLVEDFDDLLLENKPAIEPGGELEKNLIYDIEHTDIPFEHLAKKYGISKKPIYTLIKNKNLNPAPRLSSRLKIEPGSELEKALINDIENTDIPFEQLAKKYGLSSGVSIKYIIQRLNLHPFPRLKSKPGVIKPGSELEKALINDIENTDKSYVQIGKDYGIDPKNVQNFAYYRDLRPKKEKINVHVYFNTLEVDISHVNIDKIYANMKFHPSIYLGEYSVDTIERMYEYIRKKYLGTRISNSALIEFYLKIASNDISLNTLIDELKNQATSSSLSRHSSTFDYKFITASTDKLSIVDFYSANYSQLAKDILTFFSRKGFSSNEFDTVYKDLKNAAAKVDPKTADLINQINTYISNNIEKIAHNIYSKKGDIIEPTNYISGIPYETSFDVDSPQDIAACMRQYKGYLLYGFMDKTGDIIYIGISLNAATRANKYVEENRPLILKAFKDDIIKKLIIFKSNLPIQSRSVNTKLIYALEVYFAVHLFKTYPENYPKALNKAKPGQNSSRFLSSQNWDDFETYISEQDRLLSREEFMLAAEELNLSSDSVRKKYPYYKYAEEYIAKHDGELSFKDKENLYKSIPSDKRYILWNICSSENEYREIVAKNKQPEAAVNSWKNYRIKNNLPITEDLDDDIDMEYYV